MGRFDFATELNQQVIDVPRAALVYARSIAYPSLDIAYSLKCIDNIALAARSHVLVYPELVDRVDALSDFLFNQMNFRPDIEDYYDPRNSYLNEVLERQMGIPISLSVIWVAVAQRLGLPAYGIGLPGHFIVGLFQHEERTGTEIHIDPYNAGVHLSVADCNRLVRESTGSTGAFNPKWLSPISPLDILSRLLTNLYQAHIQREEWEKAIPVIQHLLMVQPEENQYLRDLGYVYLYAGSLQNSARNFEEYLRRSPHAEDFESVRTSLQIVAGRLALWN